MKTHIMPHELPKVLDFLRKGGTIILPTYTRCTVITQKTIDAWQRIGKPFLREDGNGYRMMVGRKSSVHVFAGEFGQLYYS